MQIVGHHDSFCTRGPPLYDIYWWYHLAPNYFVGNVNQFDYSKQYSMHHRTDCQNVKPPPVTKELTSIRRGKLEARRYHSTYGSQQIWEENSIIRHKRIIRNIKNKRITTVERLTWTLQSARWMYQRGRILKQCVAKTSLLCPSIWTYAMLVVDEPLQYQIDYSSPSRLSVVLQIVW